MPERNMVQAMFPEGSRVIENPHGTAPGIGLVWDRSGNRPGCLFALPGVPAEMREMWQASVGPTLRDLEGRPRRVIRHYCVRCFGVGESDLEQMLPDLIRRGRTPTVGITASKTTLTLRITGEAETEDDFATLIAPTLDSIRSCLGDLIFGEDEDELQDAVVRQLRRKAQTLATAEFGSGGMLASWLSEADPDGGTYLGGLVVRASLDRSRNSQHPTTTQEPELFDSAFSAHASWAEAASYYATQVRRRYGASYGLALGAFPRDEREDDSPGNVHVALAGPAAAESQAFPFTGHPEFVKLRSVKQALNLLRLQLLHSA
jgi:nicotinamide-nucleotide amidase